MATADVDSPIRRFLENVEVAEDLTDSMLEEEQTKAMAKLHESDHIADNSGDTLDDSGDMLDDSGFSSVSSSVVAEDQKSVAASVYDSIVDTLEKMLPIDKFDDLGDEDESSCTSAERMGLPEPPEVQREVSIENIDAIADIKALPVEKVETQDADVTPPEMGFEENEFIAAIEGAIIKEFGGASNQSEPESKSAATIEKANEADTKHVVSRKPESKGRDREKTAQPSKQAERKDTRRAASRSLFAGRRSRQAAEKARNVKIEHTASRLAQKYGSSSRMKDNTVTLTEEALERLDLETKQKTSSSDTKTTARKKSSTGAQKNDELVDSDDQYSCGSSDTEFDSETETEVETEIEKDLLDAFIDFLMFQGRPHESEYKPKHEPSLRKSKMFSRRGNKEKEVKKDKPVALSNLASLENDDEESCQYESLINISGVRSSDSFAAGSEEVPINKKTSEEEAREESDKDMNNGTSGSLPFDAAFFEELWKEAIAALRKTKLFETTPKQPMARSASLPSLNVFAEHTPKEDVETTYQPLVDDFFQDLAADEEDQVRPLFASVSKSENLDKVAQASSPLEVQSQRDSAEGMAKADLTLSQFKTRYPHLSKKIDPAKLDSIVKAEDGRNDKDATEVYAPGTDMDNDADQRVDMNVEVVHEVASGAIAVDDFSFMEEVHLSNVVSDDDDSMEESVECSFDEHRNVFNVLSEIGAVGVSGQPSTSTSREMRTGKHCNPKQHVDRNLQGKSAPRVAFTLGDHTRFKETAVGKKPTSAPNASRNKSPFRSFGAMRKAKNSSPARSRSTPAIRLAAENATLTKAIDVHALDVYSVERPSATRRGENSQGKETVPQRAESAKLRKEGHVAGKATNRPRILGVIRNRSKSSPRSEKINSAASNVTGNRPKSPWARRARNRSAVKPSQASSLGFASPDERTKETQGNTHLHVDPTPKRRWARKHTRSANTLKSAESTSHVSDETPLSKAMPTSNDARPREKITIVGCEEAVKGKNLSENSDAVKKAALNCTDTSHSSDEDMPQSPEMPRTKSMVDWQGFPPSDVFEKTRSREPRLLLRIRSVNPFLRRQSSTKMPKQASQPRRSATKASSDALIEWDDFPQINFSKSASVPTDLSGNLGDMGYTPARTSQQTNLYTDGEFDFDMFERTSTPISFN